MTFGQNANSLIGVWTYDEGFQITELLFRSDGRYQLDARSTDPVFDFSSTERGYYTLNGQSLAVTPYEYLGEPQSKIYDFQLLGGALTLTRVDFPLSPVNYQFKPGSRTEVLAREQVDHDLIGTWSRSITFAGKNEYTFRPGGYYILKKSSEGDQFPPEYIRGRYEQDGSVLTLKPYSFLQAEFQIDFFGNTLTFIEEEETRGESESYEEVPGSEVEVRVKAAAAEEFLSRVNWQVGLWEIRDGLHTTDLILRPDGRYSAKEELEILRGIVRGRYLLEPRRIHFRPFDGQGIYSRNNGEFGKVERTREIDYYDGELQIIDLEALSQSVTLARKREGSEALVLEKVHQAELERAREGWQIGIWEVNDPTGWMEFTFRPDNRYIAKSGTAGVPSQAERGEYILTAEKFTLTPYAGLGAARGFEIDLYDGDLFLVGDLNRMVIARKIANSDADVIQKTKDPIAIKGERGSILGLWTAKLPGETAELVFRNDGEFRLKRCANNAVSHDYGLYTVDMNTRSLVSDSRFVQVQTLGLDFYGDTMTIYGGLRAPSTYTVNVGLVDAAIQASQAEDATEAEVDSQWLARIPIQGRDPNVVQTPTGNIPADPFPGRIYPSPTVFQTYQLYRRLIPSFVYFNEQGTIKSVAVVNTREWHFFPTGRVLVRFKNYSAGFIYPNTFEEVSDSWGAYRIGGKPSEQDILHIYADNSLFIEMDSGEQAEMTLEDGLRYLFWGKDYQIQWEWASEQKTIPCEPAADSNPSLVNSGIALATNIKPDAIGSPSTKSIKISASAGKVTISGTNDVTRMLVVEGSVSLVAPIAWQALQTNSVPAGAFNLDVPQNGKSAFFRLRSQ